MAMLFKEATDTLRKISSVNSLECLLNNIFLLIKFFICVNIFFTYLFNKKIIGSHETLLHKKKKF